MTTGAAFTLIRSEKNDEDDLMNCVEKKEIRE